MRGPVLPCDVSAARSPTHDPRCAGRRADLAGPEGAVTDLPGYLLLFLVALALDLAYWLKESRRAR